MDIQSSGHPIFPTGIVVDSSTMKVNIVRAESPRRLGEHCLLADPNGFVGAECVVVPPIIVGIPVVGSILLLGTIAVSIRATIRRRIAGAALFPVLIVRRIAGVGVRTIPVLVIRLTAGSGRSGVWVATWIGLARVPINIKRVPFSASLFVLDLHDSDSTVTWIADELLPPPAIHARKPEIGGIRRHRASALESAPLRRLPGERPEAGRCASNLDLCNIVHEDFHGALAAVRAAASNNRRLPLSLCKHNRCKRCARSENPHCKFSHRAS
jgi:hypothetical protein